MWDIASRTTPAYAGGKPTERWFNIGLGYTMSDSAKLSILWQLSDYDSKGLLGFEPFQSGIGDTNRAKGGLVTTQLSVKF
jgi:hypothetical protein